MGIFKRTRGPFFGFGTPDVKDSDMQNIGGGSSVENFIQLLDVPNSYVGQTLKGVRVNTAETGLEFYTIPAIPPATNIYTADGTLTGYRTVNCDGNTLYFQLAEIKIGSDDLPVGSATLVVGCKTDGFGFRVEGSGGGPTLFFVQENDNRVGVGTISTNVYFDVYGSLKFVTGAQGAGKVLTSDANGNADWATPVSGATTFLALTDTPSTYVGQSLKTVRVNAGETALEFVPFGGVGGAVLNGTGIANYTARWLDVDTISTGAMRDNGSQCAIGTVPSPSMLLQLYNSANTLTTGLSSVNTDGGNFGSVRNLLNNGTQQLEMGILGTGCNNYAVLRGGQSDSFIVHKGNAGNLNIRTDNGSTGKIQFFSRKDADQTPSMIIDGNSVGIGESTPTSRLHVKTALSGSGLRVDTNGGSPVIYTNDSARVFINTTTGLVDATMYVKYGTVIDSACLSYEVNPNATEISNWSQIAQLITSKDTTTNVYGQISQIRHANNNGGSYLGFYYAGAQSTDLYFRTQSDGNGNPLLYMDMSSNSVLINRPFGSTTSARLDVNGGGVFVSQSLLGALVTYIDPAVALSITWEQNSNIIRPVHTTTGTFGQIMNIRHLNDALGGVTMATKYVGLQDTDLFFVDLTLSTSTALLYMDMSSSSILINRGIGSAANAILDVNGGIFAKTPLGGVGLRIEPNGSTTPVIYTNDSGNTGFGTSSLSSSRITIVQGDDGFNHQIRASNLSVGTSAIASYALFSEDSEFSFGVAGASSTVNTGYAINGGAFIYRAATTANKPINFINASGNHDFYSSSDATGTRIASFQSGGVGITVSGTINTSAALQVDSTTKGFLPPRMTATQASAIPGVDGLMVYVSTTNGTFTSVGFWGYVAGVWEKLNN